MPRFAANLSLLFTELPFFDRFAAAAAAGFRGVEILFPYDAPPDSIRRAMRDAGLEMVLFNAPPRDGPDPGYAAVPGGEDRFRDAMRRVLGVADILKPGLIHVMAGYSKGPQAADAFVRNLQWLADLAPEQGFALEPLNPVDQPGYFLDDYWLAADILDRVNRPNVGLQYDTYHAQVIHGDAARIWEEFADRAVHVQIGAAPDRREPGPGPVDFPALFEAIDASGYSGWVSAEYNPSTGRTGESLDWLAPYRGG